MLQNPNTQTLIHFDSPVYKLSLHSLAQPNIALSSPQWEFLLTLAEFLQVYATPKEKIFWLFSLLQACMFRQWSCVPQQRSKQMRGKPWKVDRRGVMYLPIITSKTTKFKLVHTVWKLWAIPTEEKIAYLALSSVIINKKWTKKKISLQYFYNSSKCVAFVCIF